MAQVPAANIPSLCATRLEGIVASWLIAENPKVQVAAAIQVCDQVNNHIQLTLCTAGECECERVGEARMPIVLVPPATSHV